VESALSTVLCGQRPAHGHVPVPAALQEKQRCWRLCGPCAAFMVAVEWQSISGPVSASLGAWSMTATRQSGAEQS